jgi:hypothetical protein
MRLRVYATGLGSRSPPWSSPWTTSLSSCIQKMRCPAAGVQYSLSGYWNPEKKKVVFCEQWGLLFGAVTSATGFCRLPHMLTRSARPFFAVLSDHYIDDAMQPDFAAACDSAQVSLGHLFKKVGIPFSDKKQQRPAACSKLPPSRITLNVCK